MAKQSVFLEKLHNIRGNLSAELARLQNDAAHIDVTSDSFRDEVIALDQRIEYLDVLELRYIVENKLIHPKVFISFAGKVGEKLMHKAFGEIRKMKAPDTGTSFLVETGMGKRGEPEVMRHIVDKIKPCCIFLGILTREHSLQNSDDEHNSYAPRSWVLFEAGIAIGLGLRIVFLVEDGVHKNFWFDPLGHWRHAKFDRDETAFRKGVSMATQLIKEHYRSLKKLDK